MVDFFDRLYNSIVSKNAFLDKIRFYSMLRFATRTVANILVPFYFHLTKKNPNYKLPFSKQQEGRLIVSLTSFPARIKKVHLVIETILRQTHKPNMIILWLSQEQFISLDRLPKKLLALRKRGLQIELCNGDLRSHKKYYYTLLNFQNDYMVTIDDDVFYNSHMLEFLWQTHLLFPNAVCCNHSRIIQYTNNELQPYREWKENTRSYQYPQKDILPIGVGGVLYPPLYGQNKTFLNPNLFMNLCKNADDIWLKVIGILQNINAVQTCYRSMFLPIYNKNNVTLNAINVEEGNDIQIKNIQEYCIETLNKDPFAK